MTNSLVLAQEKNESFNFQKRAEQRTLKRFTLKEWLENKTKNDDFNKNEYQLVASNGRLAVLASIAFFIKYKKELINIKLSSDKHSYDQWATEFQKDNLTGKIFIDALPDEFKNLSSLEKLKTSLNVYFNDLSSEFCIENEEILINYFVHLVTYQYYY